LRKANIAIVAWFVLAGYGLSASAMAQATVLTLEQAIELAMQHDARISEREKLVAAAQGLLQEALGSADLIYDVNAFTGLVNQVDGGFLKPSSFDSRSDRYAWNGLSTWTSVQFSIIKPLYTFGKIENYADAARANIKIKDQDVSLQRANTIIDVSRAYYGYLAARDTRYLFEDVIRRLDKAIVLVRQWLDSNSGDVRQSDLYALQAGQGLIGNYLSQAEGVEAIALAGLRLLTGVDPGDTLEVADQRLEPLSIPQQTLDELQSLALKRRPEMRQLEAGLKARRSLLAAKKAEKMPNVYAGIAGMAAYSPWRDRLDNPYIYDPFNDYGATPMIGIQWQWASGVQAAHVTQAQAELDALVEKSSFARRGIPFEVTEQYHQVQAYSQAVEKLKQASRSARRWMVSSYADFEAGVEDAENALTAFQGYVLTYNEYLVTVNDYNMHVVRLRHVTGVTQ
jgi:outer membrane protein TolC